MLYIVIAILMFGILIAVHEFGHFITAKLLGVKVNEFSIGMGPEVISRKGAETQYSLRLLPIGGYCAMEGEEGESSDPRSFENKSAWRKVIILVAGSFMNFLVGVLILLALYAGVSAARVPVITGFMDGFPLQGEEGLLPGDRIISIDGQRILLFADVNTFLGRTDGVSMDLVVERGGERISYENFPLVPREYEYNGETQRKFGLLFEQVEELGVLGRVKMALAQSADMVRIVWMSLGDLVRGAVGFKDLSGPIGIVNAIEEVGSGSETTAIAFQNILFFVAFIAINLAVMNLLPIPALDGGRIFFLVVNLLFTLFTRKKLNPKYENAVNMVGFFCLLALMAVVAISDIFKLIH